MPRIIINNALGPNKVVFIDPYHGKSQDLYQRRREKQNGIQVVGESVSIIKGTGPGSAMGIPSPNQQALLKNSDTFEKMKRLRDVQSNLKLSPSAEVSSPVSPVSSNFSKNLSKKRSSSLNKYSNLRQLNCDTVIINK